MTTFQTCLHHQKLTLACNYFVNALNKPNLKNSEQAISITAAYIEFKTIKREQQLCTNMRKWNPFAGMSESKSCKLHLTICALEGLSFEEIKGKDNYGMQVQIKWRMPKQSYLSRRTGAVNHTSKQCLNSDGCVKWNERFEPNCKLKLKDYNSTKHWKIKLELQVSKIMFGNMIR